MTSDQAAKAAKDIGDRAASSIDAAVSSASTATSNVGESVRQFAARTSDAAGDLYGNAQGRVRDAADRLPDPSEAVAAGRRTYERSSESVGRQVAKQPLEALLLAGAIGFLVGWATNRS